MKLKLLLFLLLLGQVKIFSQNLITGVTITMPANVPANTSNWASTMPPILIAAKGAMQNGQLNGMVIESKMLVTIKRNGAKVCGMYTKSTAPSANFTTAVKTWNGSEVVNLLGQDCQLQPGSYELCVQFFSMTPTRELSTEVCKPFTIADAATPNTGGNPGISTSKFTPPNNLAPTNGKTLTEAEAKKPLTFRWTPLVPKPQTPVTYRLKVWQLMQGQNGTAAMRSNQPIVTKDVDNITQFVKPNLLGDIEMINNKADLVWNVEAIATSQGSEKSLGVSEATAFGVGNAGCGTNSATVNILCDKIVEGVQTYKVTINFSNVASTGVQTCTTNMNTITSTTGVLSSITSLPAIIPSNGNISVDFIYAPYTTAATTADFSFKGIWNDGNSNTSNFSNLGVSLPVCRRQTTDCCRGGNWESEQWYGGPRINSNGTSAPLIQIDTLKRNRGTQIDTFGILPCEGKIGFKFKYKCALDCRPTQINYKVYQITGATTAVELSSTSFSNGENADIVYPTITGKYAILVRAICGKDTCNQNMYACLFNVECKKDSVKNCCEGSRWDRSIYKYKDVIKVIGTNVSDLGTFKCKENLSILANYICGRGCDKAQIKYELYQGMNILNSQILELGIPFDFIIPNNNIMFYGINITPICGGKECKGRSLIFNVECIQDSIDCCKDANWEEMLEVFTGKKGEEDVTKNLPKCESKLGEFKCKEIKEFQVCFNCGPNCGTAEIVYNIMQGSTVVSTITVKSCEKASLVTPSTAGNYSLVITAKCNGKVCKTCIYYFTVKCDVNQIDCCKYANFKDPGLLDTAGNSLGISLSCLNPKVLYINANTKLCDKDFIIKASFNCGLIQQQCPSNVVISLKNTSSGAILVNTTPSGPYSNLLLVPATLPNGSYILTIEYYCGDKICKSCKFEVIKDCIQTPINCCQSANWAEKHWYSSTGANIGSPACGDNLNLYMPTIIKCNGSLSIKGEAFCSGPNCGTSKILYNINNLTTGTIFSTQTVSSGTTATILLPNTLGSYNLEMAIICGKDTCKRCIYPFKLNCPPNNCCQYASQKSPEIYDINGTPLVVLNCDQPKPYYINAANKNCDKELIIKSSANCGSSGANCPPKIVITLINNSTSASITNLSTLIIPAALPNGTYTLTIDYYCGNTICKSCKFKIIKDCPLVLDCCKGGKWENLSYTVSSPTIKTKPVTIVCGNEYTVECLKGGSINFNPTYICGNASNCKKQVIVKISESSDFDIENTGSPAPVGFDLINSGKFNITYYAKCGDKICDSCTFTVIIKSCPVDIDCCKGGKWSKNEFPGLATTQGTCPASTSGTAPSFVINTSTTFNYSYTCNTQNSQLCTAKIKYTILNGSGVAAVPSVTNSSGVATTLNMPSSAGNYCLKVYAYCGESAKPCDSCTTCFNVICTDCNNINITQEPISPFAFYKQGMITSTGGKQIKQVTAQLVSFSAFTIHLLPVIAPIPNFEFCHPSLTVKSTIGTATSAVNMPFSLTGNRSNIVISTCPPSTIMPYKLYIKDDVNKAILSYRIKFTIFFVDGSYCEYNDITN